MPIRLPALRERATDIPDLVRHFFKQIENEGLDPKRIAPSGLELMKMYPWPGNVRELENLVRRLSALYPEDEISEAVIGDELQSGDAHQSPTVSAFAGPEDLQGAVEQHLQYYFAQFADELPPTGLHQRVLQQVEIPLLIAALISATRGNQIKAADLLGLNRNTLRKKIRDYDIDIHTKPRYGH